MQTRIGIREDIPGVLALQEQNLFRNLTEEQKKKGFVTTPFFEEQLTTLISKRGLFVVAEGQKIMGYAMAAGWDFFMQWPIFPVMTKRLPALTFAGHPLSSENTFQYGPVCIDETQRGTGLFQKLFEEMRVELNTRYPVGTTFINKINQVSYAAHTRKLNLTVIDEFGFNDNQYYMLGFDTSKTVLFK
jgi:hypothetical protein